MVGIAGIHTLIGGIRTIIIPTPIGIIPTIATLGIIKETARGGGGAAACGPCSRSTLSSGERP